MTKRLMEAPELIKQLISSDAQDETPAHYGGRFTTPTGFVLDILASHKEFGSVGANYIFDCSSYKIEAGRLVAVPALSLSDEITGKRQKPRAMFLELTHAELDNVLRQHLRTPRRNGEVAGLKTEIPSISTLYTRTPKPGGAT